MVISLLEIPCTHCNIYYIYELIYTYICMVLTNPIHRYARRQPYGQWLKNQVVTLKDVVASVPKEKIQPKFLAPANAEVGLVVCGGGLEGLQEQALAAVWP